MEDYRSNSHKSKIENTTEQKVVTKVVNGKVRTKKKSGISKLADTFISEDAQNVKSYVVLDVLIPALKKAISDIVVNGIDMILYGEAGHTKKRYTSSYISYNKYSDRRDEHEYSRARVGYSYDDIILDSRGEAEEVLDKMFELLDTYQFVSVADLYDLVGVTGNYTDNKYGWTNLRGAEPVRMRDGGYALKLPKAYPID